MKKNILLSVVILITFFMSSCYDSHYYNQYADASFYTKETTFFINEEIEFYNTSDGAVSYFWDFGDGETSTNINPLHTYTKPGTYEVALNAYGRDGKDESYLVLTINSNIKPTKLNVLVQYLGTTDIVKNCAIDLYDSESNWQNLKNPVFMGETGINGEMEFTSVNPIIYYIDAFKKVSDTTYYSNEKLGVATNKLNEGVTNYYDIFIEYLTFAPAKQRFVVAKVIESSPEIRASYKLNR